MFPLSSGSHATRDPRLPSEQSPITAECLQPPRVSCPRAWQRVPVAPVPGLRRQPKIWKRVGGPVTATGQDSYALAITELEQQGQGSRKRARHAQHIPAWGDAKWDPRAGSEHHGAQDLDEARATLAAAKQDAADPAATNKFKTRDATFPEASLRWVPRKRHNTRWPVEPKWNDTRLAVILQPSIDLTAPASLEPVETTMKMDEQQMRRRSIRRLSRRFSLFPGENSPRKLPMISLSPTKKSAPIPSPVKRPPITLSPTKVADSPLRSFRVNATPTKVVLESPKTAPPAMSPAKPASSPIAPAEDTEPASLKQTPASPSPLMFDQPIPDAQFEPEHETRRRLSLQLARRSERGSSGTSRLLALKTRSNSPNRRHSFTSVDTLPMDAPELSKSRRNTMDVFCVGPDEVRAGAVDEPTDATVARHSKAVVDVDMRTSVDIFGQSNITASSGARESTSGELGVNATPVLESELTYMLPPNTNTSIDDGLHASNAVSAFPTSTSDSTDGTGVEAGAEDASLRQAAARPTPCHIQPDHGFIPTLTDSTDTEEPQIMFVPHDPEGLSTIYEEASVLQDQPSSPAGVNETAQPPAVDVGSRSSANEARTPDELNEDRYDPQSKTATPSALVDEASAQAEAMRSIPGSGKHSLNTFQPDVVASQNAANEQLMAESAAATHPLFNIPTGHVGVDAMSSPDSPRYDVQASSIEIQQQVPCLQPEKEKEMSHVSTGIDPDEADGLEHFFEQVPEGTDSPSLAVVSTPLPGTPPSVPATQTIDHIVTPEANGCADAMQQESSGFTPINGRQSLPPNVLSSRLPDEEEAEAIHDSDELDDDEVVEEELPANNDDEATVAIDEDMLTGEAPHPENDTLQLQARRDDSETEMLRKFVTRVTADKNAKAAAAAAALAKKTARRSGSLGSITSSTGSPMARQGSETPTSRTPLGAKSPNSPTPTKKRKHELVKDDLTKDKSVSEDPSIQHSDGPRLKRRRKRTDPVLESESATSSPELDSLPSTGAGSGPRRSSRARSTRVALKPAAPSANSIALSMIPVRLPGMGAMDDAALDAHLTSMARQRSEEKDLAAITRGNTRKNKGGAVPPQVVLAKQAEDPSWRRRELKGVFEARERRAKEREEGGESEGKEKRKKAKGVRWAEELVRYQSDEPSVYRGMASQLLADVMMADEIAEAEPPAVAEPPVEKTARVAVRRAAAVRSAAAAAAASSATAEVPVSTRRTRSSRLPPPTPVKKIAGKEKPAAAETAVPETTAAPSLKSKAKSLPNLASASSALEPAAATSTRSGMATRRTRFAKLEMSGNGTPAPKRRGRTAT
ncbi:hypothetical protein N657DRAFT_624756 [Parathielavia appendiculata]|uniref:Uncharacterized protein n=1 Tax=Parathielavia appendiculata TaxID=2587402 RepID=A0AAN6Z1K7_9PEZI|nr:hypothetical protein N657DRAFT_624756 [Parathielavia appendiculata]